MGRTEDSASLQSVAVHGGGGKSCSDGDVHGFRCLICLDDKESSERAHALRCKHSVCEPCLSAQWTHSILKDSVAFPRCAVPGCPAYGADAAVTQLVGPVVASRMRQLRALKPARAADGRRMYCIAHGCYEQLPPPPPPPQDAAQNDEHNNDTLADMVSTCPACFTQACMRCGTHAHPGKPCAKPLVCARQRRMYQAWAVGRLAACPRCGVHIERNGGCRTVTCSRCSWAFTFSPFRNAEEVAEANEVRELSPAEVVPVSWANAFGVLLSASFSMVLGAVVSGVFCSYLIAALSKWQLDWFLLFIIPQFIMGCIFFVLGFFGVLAICRDLLPQVGAHTPRSISNVIGIAALSGSMLGAQFYVRDLLASSGVQVELWQWLLCFLPVIVCNLTLLGMSISHLIIVIFRALRTLRRRNGFTGVDDNNSNDESALVQAHLPARLPI